MSSKRLVKNQLLVILEQLTERDKAVLAALRTHKYLTTNQLQRLYFLGTSNQAVATRTTNRSLKRLEDQGLIVKLKRRIGGVRAGSAAYVWALSPAGYRLLALLDGDGLTMRKRVYEPSAIFLQHTLAIAEVSIRLIELTRRHKVGLIEQQTEPACWRPFATISGAMTLRPDLFVITSNSHYEDYWFIEVDLATESPAVVVRKCQQYLTYQQSGKEQQRYGVFPLVLWIVPDSKRIASLTKHIAKALPADKDLFIVVTLDQLESLILDGASAP